MFVYFFFEELAYIIMEAEVCRWQDGDRRATGAAEVGVQKPESQEN